ncbi:LLM class flavin-dependent oxidoreductase [Streptomyces sp. NPDC000594]|uniref:LLM class flavin-dependent oxidoreductase n=1 Tax=Streptomyces sp. NPDC000594 TaxID=3154261 RepID=UPI00332346D9
MFLGMAIDATGCHPDSRRHFPGDPLDPEHPRRLAREAERGGLDFVTLDDSMALPEGSPAALGRPDALTVLAGIAPLTSTIGLLATVTTTYCEPFHVSRALATLDHISRGRAGWRPRVAATAAEAAHFGPEPLAGADELHAEQDEFTEVVIKLWDSWEDGAEIRDVATGRFLDRSRLRRVEHAGEHFRVQGPANVPRPPQGHPVLAVGFDPRAHRAPAPEADLVLVEVADAREARARVGAHTRVIGELEVLFSGDHGVSDWSGPAEGAGRRRAGFAGTPGELARLLGDLWESGDVDGFHLRPAFLPTTLSRFTAEVVPVLRQRSRLRPYPYSYPYPYPETALGPYPETTPHPSAETTLRARLGLPASAPNVLSA